MPIYSYRCPECSGNQEIIKPVSDCTKEECCTACGGLMHRNYQAEAGIDTGKDYASTFYSDSLAIHPEQIPEHKQKFPDVEVARDGRVGFRSPKQQSDYLRKIGWGKDPQRKTRRTTNIA